METIEAEPDTESAEPESGLGAWWAKRSLLHRSGIGAGVIASIVLVVISSKIRSTMITVVLAVAVCAGIWIGANLLFDQARDRWQRFQAVSFGILGAFLGVLLHGNGLTLGSGGGFLPWLLGPLLGGAAFGALGFFLAGVDGQRERLIMGVGAFAGAGLVAALLLRSDYHPGVDWLAAIVYTAIFAAIGGGLGVLAQRGWQTGALVGAALGWVLGYWGGADVGGGNVVTAIIGVLVPAILLGARVGQAPNPDYHARVGVDRGSRAWIFLGPGLLFITAMLVIPTIRTAYLSLLDRDSVEFVWLENYQATFTDKASWDASEWTNMFTSFPFLLGIAVLGIAALVGGRQKRLTGRAVELGSPTMAPLVIGFLLTCFGVFAALRGTIINNLWWVVTVTFFSTAIGLAIAVLADGRPGEKIAKSVIFMPMALSLVGASVIWRFVYQTRDISKEQTGIANALWIGLGQLSTGSGLPTLLVAILLGLFIVAILALLARMLVRREYGRSAFPAVLLLVAGWIFLRYTQIVGGGIGGFKTNDSGELVGNTIVFVQESPYNNVWLMVILIWIQVGFTMVILSAAIKAVPTELIEAAKIDGANDSQVFWRVTLPQIATTIGVVVTTLIVLVMKVFDIVKVVTNGQFDTQVLANDMYQQAFNNIDVGRGAALAMLIFISVLPVMYLNIRRMQEEV
ncbi:MAG: sugar ABC transporter permease [Actinomycetia bacterium]|nr:sugar ABC transporter permease [Actinomycetes bacterium]